MKKFLITTLALTLMATSAMSATCVAPKYQKDKGTQVISAVMLPFTLLFAAVAQVGRVANDPALDAAADKALCGPKVMWSHVKTALPKAK